MTVVPTAEKLAGFACSFALWALFSNSPAYMVQECGSLQNVLYAELHA